MSCAICSLRPPILQWCGCTIICENCLRNTIIETGTIKCVHCRRMQKASPRMLSRFLRDVFDRKATYSFARQVLSDLQLARKLYDFMLRQSMDTRLLVELLSSADADLALHVIRQEPERFCLFRHTVRNTPEVAREAVRLHVYNLEFLDQPIPLDILELAAGIGGLICVPEEERQRLAHNFDQILAREGNVDVLRIDTPTRRQWLIAAKATPILASQVPGAELQTVEGVLRMASETRSVGFYRYLPDRLRQDRLLAHELLDRQLEYDTHFDFLQFVQFKPGRVFTERCLRACPRGLRFAAEYDEETALACVRHDGMLLQHSLHRSLRVCRAAVECSGLALQFCGKLRRRLQIVAVQNDPMAVAFAPDKHSFPMMQLSMPAYLVTFGAEKIPDDLLAEHVLRDPALMRYVPLQRRTPAMGFKKKEEEEQRTAMQRFILENDLEVQPPF